MNTFNGVGITNTSATTPTSTSTLGTNVSQTVTGTQINMRATTVNTLFGSNTQLAGTLTVVGLDSGARVTIPITINKTA
jgi:hypothetical protein